MTKRTLRLRRSAQIRLGIAAIIVVLTSVFIVLPKYQELSEKRSELATITSGLPALKDELNTKRKIYREQKEEYAAQATTDRDAVGKILPNETAQTAIVRMLEEYTNSLAKAPNQLTLQSIDFGKVTEEKDVDYLTLPLKITINSDRANLNKLLSYLESTGFPPDDRSNATRLLSVKEINVQIADDLSARQIEEQLKGPVDIDLLVHAYLLPSLN